MKKCVITVIIILFILFAGIFAHKNQSRNNITTIKFSSWGSQTEIQILKNLLKEYENRNSNIKIDFIHIPQNYFQKIQLLFASNLQPDVVFFNNQNIQMYINADLLEDLTPYINKNLFYQESINCFAKNNKIYAIPRDISSLVIYYNKDIFKKAGIIPVKKFKTLEELKNTAIKLTDKNHYGINFEEDSIFWNYYLASNGGGILSDDKKELIINKEESIDALKLYSDLINKYNAAPSKSQIGSMTTAQMFINGELAMYLSGRWMTPKFRETINFDWDIAEFPASDKNKLYIDASGWAVSKKSKNKQEAIKLIQFLSSEESLTKLGETGLIIPANIEASKNIINFDKNKKPKNSYLFLEMLNTTKPTPINENYTIINDILKEKFQSLFNGTKQPDEILDNNTINKLERLL